jgi:hypothetical protein
VDILTNNVLEINMLPCTSILWFGSTRCSGIPELPAGWFARGLEPGFTEATNPNHT